MQRFKKITTNCSFTCQLSTRLSFDFFQRNHHHVKRHVNFDHEIKFVLLIFFNLKSHFVQISATAEFTNLHFHTKYVTLLSHINFICEIAHAYQHMPAYFHYITQNHAYLPTHTRTWVPMMAQWPPLMRGHPFWEATFTQHLGWLLVRGFTVPANKSCLRLHSVLSSKTLDASSASQFSDPGQWAALTQISRSIANIQMSRAMVLHGLDRVDPCLLTHATAVVLSVMILICMFESLLQRLFSASKIAFSSRPFMCICSSWSVQHPPPWHPQPTLLASVKIV